MSLGAIASDPDSNEALWLYVRISTGDLGQLTASYSELGRQRNRTKQAQQQETERAMRVIAKHKPQLAKHMSELLSLQKEPKQEFAKEMVTSGTNVADIFRYKK